MKAKLLLLILTAAMLIPTTVNAKSTPYYIIKGNRIDPTGHWVNKKFE